MNTHTARYALLTSTVACLAIAGPATAQSAAPTPPAPTSSAQQERDPVGDTSTPSAQAGEGARDDALGVNDIIVTGSIGSRQRRIDSSYAISVLDAEQIAELRPKTTAELFQKTPGIWSESSGGDTGANIFVRGFAQSSGAQFVTIQLNGLPIYAPPSVGFIENSALFRLDESIGRLEGLRGGTSTVLSNGQAGATFNFLQKKGGERSEGLVKLTGTDFGTKRVDAWIGGPLASDWSYSVGGFYRSSPGYRDPEYEGDQGGQVEAQLTHRGEGELNLWARYTDDNNTWYLPIPLLLDGDGDYRQFPGFGAGRGTFQSNDTRLGTIEIGRNGATKRLDSKDGRGVSLGIIGASYERELGDGWKLDARASFTKGEAHTKGLVGASVPQTLDSYIAATIAGANADPKVLAAAGRAATGVAPGSLVLTGSNAAITDLGTQVLTAGFWSVEEEYDNFNAELRVGKELFQGNTLTIGGYLATVNFEDVWYLGSNMLLTATENGQRIDFALDNGARPTREGFVGAPFFDRNLRAESTAIAGYLTDEWQLTPKLRIDAGVRVERYEASGAQEGVAFGVDLDGNPLTLQNNAAAILDGTYTPFRYRDTQVSYTAGANYAFTDRVQAFARLNSGGKFPTFDDLANGQLATQTIKQYELGLKLGLQGVTVFATVFRNEFENIPFFDLQPSPANPAVLVPVLSGADSRANGVEAEVVLRPFDGLQIATTATYQDGRFTSGPNDGNKVFRQPDYLMRVEPSYSFSLGDGRGRIFVAGEFVGKRFSDTANLQPIKGYQKFDAGIDLDIARNLAVAVSVDNITDVIGLTERDPRASGSGVTNGVFYGRPIFGRTFLASATFKF